MNTKEQTSDIIKEESVKDDNSSSQTPKNHSVHSGQADKETEQTKTKEEIPETNLSSVMGSLIKRSPTQAEVGTIVEGSVINIDKSSLYVDLPPFGTGIIYGREFINVRDVIKKINIGDTIAAKIVEAENEDGYVELSLKEARQAIVWEEAEKVIKSKTILELLVRDANKGGLILEWQGIAGFLPASHLNPNIIRALKTATKKEYLTS